MLGRICNMTSETDVQPTAVCLYVQVNDEMLARAERGRHTGELEAGYESDLEQEEAAIAAVARGGSSGEASQKAMLEEQLQQQNNLEEHLQVTRSLEICLSLGFIHEGSRC